MQLKNSKVMKYTIKPYIQVNDGNLGMFVTEIHQLTLLELQDIIDSCEDVMSNEGKELYWGWHVSSLDMTKETTTLSYNNEPQLEIPTIEIYNMLKVYRDKLHEYENTESPHSPES
jgi:hypothetical protein